MIHLSVPFLTTKLEQIPDDFVKNGGFVEGNVFDYNLLKNESDWKLLDKNLSYLQKKYQGVVKSLHFPTENANYLESSFVKNALYRFIETCSNHTVGTLVLHSNYIQDIKSFRVTNLEAVREKFLTFYEELDNFLEKSGVLIGVENMPIIGDTGVDFDSVFVYPDDFKSLNFKNIYVTWDFGHWAYTCFVLQNLNNFSNKINIERCEFKDYLKLKNKIIHAHFSSFKGTTYPFSNSQCREGVPPSEGDFDQDTLKGVLLELNNWNDMNLTLEIKEKDYSVRENLNEVTTWVNKVIKK